MKKIIDETLSLENGAIKTMYGFNKSYYYKFLIAFCEQNQIPIKIPFSELSEEQKRLVLYGNAKQIDFFWKRNRLKRTFEGVVKIAYDMLKDEKDLNDYMSEKICKDCGGHRLKAQNLAVKVANKGLGEILDMSVEDCTAFFSKEANFSYLNAQEKLIAKPILKEINERLFFLYDVGLGYLSLGRDARSISGGEAQRIRIASQIGSGLSGVMYVLDEPSIGLHERDTQKLIKTLRNLQEKGNTLIVVEHDKMTIKEADFIVDIGPRAGKFGGEVVFAGTYKELLKSKSETALYMSGKKQISYSLNRPQKKWLKLKNVSINNIKNLNANFPLQNLVAITGVSGSGKSSLILQTLLPSHKKPLITLKRLKNLEALRLRGLSF